MKKEVSFQWFCYGTACTYKRILKKSNVLKLWGNTDLHNKLVNSCRMPTHDRFAHQPLFLLCFSDFISIVRPVNCY